MCRGVRVSAQSDFLGDVCYDVTGNITSCKLFQPHISHSTLEKYYHLCVSPRNTTDINKLMNMSTLI